VADDVITRGRLQLVIDDGRLSDIDTKENSSGPPSSIIETNYDSDTNMSGFSESQKSLSSTNPSSLRPSFESLGRPQSPITRPRTSFLPPKTPFLSHRTTNLRPQTPSQSVSRGRTSTDKLFSWQSIINHRDFQPELVFES
jgi:hypothetical protein